MKATKELGIRKVEVSGTLDTMIVDVSGLQSFEVLLQRGGRETGKSKFCFMFPAFDAL